jgi:phytoene synthase
METSSNARDIVRQSGSNFASSFWFLPKEKRRALDAVYAYCRLTDDLVDMESDPAEARRKLAAWRKETTAAMLGTSSNPVLAELAWAAGRYRIPETYFQELMDGVEMDIDKSSYATFDELYGYCYRVASVVGLMCLEVFEYRDARTKNFAIHLGLAFQLTNILRDLKSDAALGRTYLPDEDLRYFGLIRSDLLALSRPGGLSEERAAALGRLVAFECHRAEEYYAKARDCFFPGDRPNLVAAEVMTAVYHAILRKIQREPLIVLQGKVRLPKWESALRALQGWAVNRLGL